MIQSTHRIDTELDSEDGVGVVNRGTVDFCETIGALTSVHGLRPWSGEDSCHHHCVHGLIDAPAQAPGKERSTVRSQRSAPITSVASASINPCIPSSASSRTRSAPPPLSSANRISLMADSDRTLGGPIEASRRTLSRRPGPPKSVDLGQRPVVAG